MAVSARLSRSLHVTLGEDGAADMVAWMQGVESGRSEIRELHDLYAARTQARFDVIEARIDSAKNEVLSAMDHRFADLIKWSFLFWCGAVGAALLAQASK
jgi:hypothetical protein